MAYTKPQARTRFTKPAPAPARNTSSIPDGNLSNVMQRRPGNLSIQQNSGEYGNAFNSVLGAPNSSPAPAAAPATGGSPTGGQYGPNQNAKSSSFNAMFTRNPVFEQVGISPEQAAMITANPQLSRDFNDWYYTDPMGFMNQASINGGQWDQAMTPYRFRYPGTAGAPNATGGFTPQPPSMTDDLASLFAGYNDSLNAALSGLANYQPQQPAQQSGMDPDMMALLMSLVQGQGGGGNQGYMTPGYIYGG